MGIRQEIGNYHGHNFSGDLLHIGNLRDVFATFGIKESNPTKILSYNPILDRFNYEKRILEGMDDEERDVFARNITFQMETNLRERYRVVSSVYDLLIKNNRLCSSLDKQEYLQEIFWRGLEYRKSIGSKEQTRELSELLGFIDVTQKELISEDAEEGTTIIVISPPGIISQTAYPKNFIDILKLKNDQTTMQKKVEATRFVSALSYNEYAEIIQQLQADYFDGFVPSMPIDGWYLSHPIKVDSRFEQLSPNDIFTALFCGDPLAMKNEDFLSVIMTHEMMQFIDNYVNKVMSDKLDPVGIIVAYHAIVNYGDYLLRSMNSNTTILRQDQWHRRDALTNHNVEYWGHQEVVAMPAGCGNSGGFTLVPSVQDFLPKNTLEQFFGNSIGQFGVDTFDYKNDPNLCRCGGNEPHFHCPGKAGSCGHVIIVGKGITTCPECGQGKTC